MKTFTLTHHAMIRMKERDIPDPNVNHLALVKNKLRKYVKTYCRKNGYDTKLVYWRTYCKVPSIYVCSATGVNEYLVITAFKYDKTKPNENV
jgi:hypothetical protein